ncbi:hypothetical protein DSUL_20163 [Desulfovibrionales bacterium]
MLLLATLLRFISILVSSSWGYKCAEGLVGFFEAKGAASHHYELAESLREICSGG